MMPFLAKALNMTTLVGPKWDQQIQYIFTAHFEVSRGRRGRQDGFRRSEPDRLGGGRGSVNPPPVGLFGGFGGLEGSEPGSQHLHA